MIRNGKCRIARFTQHHVGQLKMQQTPLEFMKSQFPSCEEGELRGQLSRFGLSGIRGHQLRPTMCTVAYAPGIGCRERYWAWAEVGQTIGMSGLLECSVLQRHMYKHVCGWVGGYMWWCRCGCVCVCFGEPEWSSPRASPCLGTVQCTVLQKATFVCMFVPRSEVLVVQRTAGRLGLDYTQARTYTLIPHTCWPSFADYSAAKNPLPT